MSDPGVLKVWKLEEPEHAGGTVEIALLDNGQIRLRSGGDPYEQLWLTPDQARKVGFMLRAFAALQDGRSEQSGGSISADCPCGEGKNPLHAFLNCGQPPHSNKSGGS